MERRFPTLDATGIPVSRSKGQRSGSPLTRPINADTHRAPYLPNGKAYELQTWYTDGGRRPASATGAMTSKVKGQGHVISLSRVGLMAHKSKANSRSIAKIGWRVPDDTCYTAHHAVSMSKGQGLRPTNADTQNVPAHIFRTVRPIIRTSTLLYGLPVFYPGTFWGEISPQTSNFPPPPRT